MDFANRLKELRTEVGLSTTELGKLIGMSQSAISKLENGQRRIDLETLESICNALNKTFADFFNFESHDQLPPDLLQLIETAKKLTPEERKKFNDLLQTILERTDRNER
jgi:HTH-type transcriptional regulator, repressor for puuD